MPDNFTVSVPASSANLGPGYDCLGLALNLRNKISLESASANSLEFKGLKILKHLQDIKKNLFFKVFHQTLDKLGKDQYNKACFKFSFNTQIPFTRGLGSSSAMIIAAIAAALKVAGQSINNDKILSHALSFEHHPDNITPACLGGFITAVVQNNKVIYNQTLLPNYLKAVVVIPNQYINTKQSRKALKSQYSLKDASFNIAHATLLTASLIKGDFKSLKLASRDKLHQDLRMQAMPKLFEVQQLALKSGALMSTLSGSGSTMFQLVFEQDAKKLATILAKTFVDCRVKILDFDNEGLIIHSI